MNKYLYMIIIFFIIYFIFINTSLLFYTNSTYKLHNDLNLKKNELLICSHNYEYIDLFIIINEYIKKKTKINIILKKNILNDLLKYYLYSIGVFNIHFIYVRGGTVKKIRNIIVNEPVIIFLHEYKSSTGIYHILNNSDIKAYICKITSLHKPIIYDIDNVSYLDIFFNNFGKHYDVRYKKLDYITELSPDKFINKLRKRLY